MNGPANAIINHCHRGLARRRGASTFFVGDLPKPPSLHNRRTKIREKR